jgi:hypothetical protein
VAVNTEEPNAIYFGDGSGGFQAGLSFGRTDGRTFSVDVADLDRDGDQDIVVGNFAMQNAIFFNRGDGRTFTELRFGREEGVTYWLATGDVNGDGFLDIVRRTLTV